MFQDQIELDPVQVLTNGNIMLLFLPKSWSGDCVSWFRSESRSSSPRRVEGELNVDDEGLLNVQVLARPLQILQRRIRVKVEECHSTDLLIMDRSSEQKLDTHPCSYT